MLGWVRLRLKLRLNQSVAYQHSMITCQSADDNIHCFHCLCFHGDREFFCVRCVHRPIWWIRMWSDYCEWRQRFAQRDICISNVRKSRGSRTSVSVHVYRRPRGTRSSGLPRLQSTRNATRVRFFLFLTILSKFYVCFFGFPAPPILFDLIVVISTALTRVISLALSSSFDFYHMAVLNGLFEGKKREILSIS